MTPQCQDCAFYEVAHHSSGEPDKGVCHRYPPTLICNESHYDWQPVTPATGWCGEFKAKEKVQ